MIQPKTLEVFCGTGGVGKTTLATARAASLAEHGRRVLLITIDPAKRLKEVLQLDEKHAGRVEQVKNLGQLEFDPPLDALLISPTETLKKIAIKHNVQADFENRILKILARPYGGMNEILSMVELNFQLEKEVYDTIVLDTPPGNHFIDFLDSCRKFQQFFDQKFVDIFRFLNNRNQNKREKTKIMTRFLSTGLKKLLSYFEKVTGASFIEEFIDAVSTIYSAKESFLQAINLQEMLTQQNFSNWVLVTSSEHGKLQEAMTIKDSAKNFIHQDSFVAINKCLGDNLNNWIIPDHSQYKKNLEKLKNSMLVREENLKNEARNIFPLIMIFPEILASSPQEHVLALKNDWSKLGA